MSEHNPFAAPTGAPALAPMLAPPMALLPASPMAPPVPPPPVGVPAQAVRYDHPASTLTELSFAPVATDEPPPVAEPVEPPATTLNSILPSGGGARRSLSLGGRLPLIALVLVALLAIGGVVFSTGLLGGDKADPAPVTTKTTTTPAKPPTTATNGFKAFPVTKASGTLGRSYTIDAPASWVTQKNTLRGPAHTDLVVGSKTEGVIVQSVGVPLGGTLPDLTRAGRKGAIKAVAGKAKGDIRKTTVGGVPARQFDVIAKDGTQMRATTFVDGNTFYLVMGSTDGAFAKYAPTYQRVLKSWKFTGK